MEQKTRNAGQTPGRRGGNHNPTGKGGFREHPELRNRNGQRNAAAVAFARSLRELIVAEGESVLEVAPGKHEKKVALMVLQLWNAAIRGESWAVQFIAERTEGRVPQQIHADVTATAADPTAGLSDEEAETLREAARAIVAARHALGDGASDVGTLGDSVSGVDTQDARVVSGSGSDTDDRGQ